VVLENDLPAQTNDVIPIPVPNGKGQSITPSFQIPRGQIRAILRTPLRAESRVKLDGLPGRTNLVTVELRPLPGVVELLKSRQEHFLTESQFWNFRADTDHRGRSTDYPDRNARL